MWKLRSRTEMSTVPERDGEEIRRMPARGCGSAELEEAEVWKMKWGWCQEHPLSRAPKCPFLLPFSARGHFGSAGFCSPERPA